VTGTVTPKVTLTGTPEVTGTVTPRVTSTPRPTQTATGRSHKVTICHRTGSRRHPYVQITVDESALPAHRRHGDIIPAPPGGCPAVTPGSTRTARPIPTGTVQALGVTICHRTGSQRNPYVMMTISASAVPAHAAHGDII